MIASCSVDRTIRIWDLRDGKKPKLSWEAHESDVNVISWNTECKYLLASGADDGCFRVWDLREVQRSAKKGAGEASPSPITDIRWHGGPITSLQFQPREESVLVVSSADDKVSLWDFSVEPDELGGEVAIRTRPGEHGEEVEEIPPQLMFLHQG